MKRNPPSHYPFPRKPVSSEESDEKLKTRLTGNCNRLNMDFDTDLSAEINEKTREVIIKEYYTDKNGEAQVRRKNFPYGYGAAARLEVLYLQHFNLSRLVEVVEKLKKFGYDIVDHTLPSVDIDGSISIVEHSTAEESHVCLTDEEVSKYEKLLERCLVTRYLAEIAPEAKEEYGVEIKIFSDGFGMTKLATNSAIIIPNFNGFTPRHGIYPFNQEAIDAALKVAGLISDDDD